MKNWPTITDEYAGLSYRLSFQQASQGDPMLAYLEIEGTPPLPVARIDPGSYGKMDQTSERHLPGVQARARQELTLITTLLADAAKGWALTFRPSVTSAHALALSLLTQRSQPFHTEWNVHKDQSTRTRLQCDEQGVLLAYAQAMPVNWAGMAAEHLNTREVVKLDMPTQHALRNQLENAFRSDPVLVDLALTLESTALEQRSTKFSDAVTLLSDGSPTLRAWIDDQYKEMNVMMARHTAALLERNRDLLYINQFVLDLVPDAEDDEHAQEDSLTEDMITWHKGARRAKEKVIECGSREEALALWTTFVDDSLFPVPTRHPGAKPGDPEAMLADATFLEDLVWLITGDWNTGNYVKWMSRVHPELTPTELLWWLWSHFVQHDEAPGLLRELFTALQRHLEDRAQFPFNSAETFYSYLLAQLSANGYREVSIQVQGQVQQTLIVDKTTLRELKEEEAF